MKFSSFVGRTKELERLRQVLLRDDSAGLVIQSIEGPGGIGKSSIFNRILDDLQLTSQGFIILGVDGNKGGNVGLDQLIGSLIESANVGKLFDRPVKTFFPRSSDAISAAERLRSESIELLAKKSEGDDSRERFSRFFNSLVSVGKHVNLAVPGSKSVVDAEELEKHAPNISETVEKLGLLKEETVYFWEKFGISDAATIRNEIRRGGAPRALAQCLADDLKQIILGKSESGELQPGLGSVKGIKHALLIVDDYESLQSIIGEFLISHFLDCVKKIGFAVTVIILGRDKLSVTNTSWNQHHSSVMASALVIKPLSKDEMNALLDKLDVLDPTERERAWADTRGYPYYVTLWADELSGGGRSAVTLKQFYSRITKWMTDRQRGWLDQVSHMRDVNLTTLKAVFGVDEAEEVMTWFENEASVRDPDTALFTVNEYTRSRILEYQALRDPDGHAVLAKRAAQAGN